MPVLQNSNPWMTALLGLAAEAQGYSAQKQQNVQNQNAAAQLALEQSTQSNDQRYRDKDLKLRAAQYNLDPDTFQPIKSNVKYDPPPKNPKGDDLANWAAQQYAKALSANNGAGDPAGIDMYGKAVTAYPRAEQEEGSAHVSGARVDQIRDYIKNGYKQKMELLMTRLNGEQRLRMMAAYRRAGGGSGNSERESIALATAMNAINKSSYDEALQSGRDQYNHDMTLFGNTFDPKTGEGFNAQTGGMSNAPPTINNYTNVALPGIWGANNGQLQQHDARTGQTIGGGKPSYSQATSPIAQQLMNQYQWKRSPSGTLVIRTPKGPVDTGLPVPP